MIRPFKRRPRGADKEKLLSTVTPLSGWVGRGCLPASRTSWTRVTSAKALHGTAAQAMATEGTPMAPSPLLTRGTPAENSDALM